MVQDDVTHVTRRCALAGGALVLAPSLGKATAARRGYLPTGDGVRSGPDIAVARTTLGPVRGYSDRGIFTFKGLPYAVVDSKVARFLPPKPPSAWISARTCMAYGPSSPQRRSEPQNDEQRWLYPRGFLQDDDDCLRINIWSPGLDDGHPRPVMVWLHGGGFVNGSGNEMAAFDGRNLSARGDVVVVTLNHRLNVFGFLDFSALGSELGESENLGLQDIVAALRWIRSNIGFFGGTPDNVTLFGQSGGGGKILALMGMPAARGLFHRAIVQSAPYFSAADTARARFTSKSEALTAARAAASAFQAASPGGHWSILPSDALIKVAHDNQLMAGLAPIEGGQTLPHHPLTPERGKPFNDVPLLIGNTLHEASWSLVFAENEGFTKDQVTRQLSSLYGSAAAELYEAAARVFPRAKPIELLDILDPTRFETVRLADRMASRSQFSVYNYVFAHSSPALGGRVRAVHNSDIPYVFMNTGLWPEMTGDTRSARQVAASVADGWLAFARTGSPQHERVPAWNRYRESARVTMFLDRYPRSVTDYDSSIRAILPPGLLARN